MVIASTGGNGGGIRLGRLLGAPLSVSAWWFPVALVITVLFAPSYRSVRPDLPAGAEYLLAAALVVLLYVSVLLHELGHAVAARSFGIPVIRIRLDVLGGFTEMTRPAGTPVREAIVAGAGPAVSVGLALGGLAMFVALPAGSIGALLVGQLAAVNGLVSAFNLLPGLPLDGGALVRSFVWAISGNRSAATVVAAWTGRGVAVLTALLPLLLAIWLGGRPTLFGAFWFLILAGSIWAGASAVLAQERMRQLLPMLRVASLMRPVLTVHADEPVADVLHRVNTAHASGAVVTDQLGRPVALVVESAVRAVPAQRQHLVPARAVARQLGADDVLGVDLAGAALLETLANRAGTEHVVLADGDRPVGLLRSSDVERALSRSRSA